MRILDRSFFLGHQGFHVRSAGHQRFAGGFGQMLHPGMPFQIPSVLDAQVRLGHQIAVRNTGLVAVRILPRSQHAVNHPAVADNLPREIGALCCGANHRQATRIP